MDHGLMIIATAVAMILVQKADAFEDLLRAAAQRLRSGVQPLVTVAFGEPGADDDPTVASSAPTEEPLVVSADGKGRVLQAVGED
jgi:hypothetical protein